MVRTGPSPAGQAEKYQGSELWGCQSRALRTLWSLVTNGSDRVCLECRKAGSDGKPGPTLYNWKTLQNLNLSI